MYYAMSKLYLTSSLTEMNSISMLEAMAMGLPVLQRMDEVNKDQILEGKNGYIFFNENDMYKHLKKLSEYTEELEVYKKAMERGRLQEMMKRKNKEKGVVKRIGDTIKRKI